MIVVYMIMNLGTVFVSGYQNILETLPLSIPRDLQKQIEAMQFGMPSYFQHPNVLKNSEFEAFMKMPETEFRIKSKIIEKPMNADSETSKPVTSALNSFNFMEVEAKTERPTFRLPVRVPSVFSIRPIVTKIKPVDNIMQLRSSALKTHKVQEDTKETMTKQSSRKPIIGEKYRKNETAEPKTVRVHQTTANNTLTAESIMTVTLNNTKKYVQNVNSEKEIDKSNADILKFPMSDLRMRKMLEMNSKKIMKPSTKKPISAKKYRTNFIKIKISVPEKKILKKVDKKAAFFEPINTNKLYVTNKSIPETFLKPEKVKQFTNVTTFPLNPIKTRKSVKFDQKVYKKQTIMKPASDNENGPHFMTIKIALPKNVRVHKNMTVNESTATSIITDKSSFKNESNPEIFPRPNQVKLINNVMGFPLNEKEALTSLKIDQKEKKEHTMENRTGFMTIKIAIPKNVRVHKKIAVNESTANSKITDKLNFKNESTPEVYTRPNKITTITNVIEFPLNTREARTSLEIDKKEKKEHTTMKTSGKEKSIGFTTVKRVVPRNGRGEIIISKILKINENITTDISDIKYEKNTSAPRPELDDIQVKFSPVDILNITINTGVSLDPNPIQNRKDSEKVEFSTQNDQNVFKGLFPSTRFISEESTDKLSTFKPFIPEKSFEKKSIITNEVVPYILEPNNREPIAEKFTNTDMSIGDFSDIVVTPALTEFLSGHTNVLSQSVTPGTMKRNFDEVSHTILPIAEQSIAKYTESYSTPKRTQQTIKNGNEVQGEIAVTSLLVDKNIEKTSPANVLNDKFYKDATISYSFFDSPVQKNNIDKFVTTKKPHTQSLEIGKAALSSDKDIEKWIAEFLSNTKEMVKTAELHKELAADNNTTDKLFTVKPKVIRNHKTKPKNKVKISRAKKTQKRTKHQFRNTMKNRAPLKMPKKPFYRRSAFDFDDNFTIPPSTTTKKITTTTQARSPNLPIYQMPPMPYQMPPMPYPLPPIPVPIQIQSYPQMPLILPMRSYYEPVIHHHPPLDKIREFIERDTAKWEKEKYKKHYKSSSESEYFEYYDSFQYYDDVLKING